MNASVPSHAVGGSAGNLAAERAAQRVALSVGPLVGNDVVDLRDPDASAEREPRFDARVFDEAERALIEQSSRPARTRWQLWACKEAAYKAVVRRAPQTVFSPSQFRVSLYAPSKPDGEVSLRGTVRTPVGELSVAVREEHGAIHALASGDPARLVAGMTRVAMDPADPQAPSASLRRFVQEQLYEQLAVEPSQVEIRKRGRIPELWVRGRRRLDISLSHHGEMVAFACEAPDGCL